MENGNEPAAKPEGAAVIDGIDTTNERIDTHRSELQHCFDGLKKTMSDNQAELLNAFSSYAQSASAKLDEDDIAGFILGSRLTAMESRQTDMERRLNTPPQE